MTCANTSLPTYIIYSRDGSHRRVANLVATVQVGDSQNHEKMLSVLWVTPRSLNNVGTLLNPNVYSCNTRYGFLQNGTWGAPIPFSYIATNNGTGSMIVDLG